MSDRPIQTVGETMDVLIPVIEKDLAVLPYVIDGIRKQVVHPIGDIYIVAPNSKKIKEVCKRKNCQYIFEDEVLPISKKDLDGDGWMLQQLIKLSCDTIASNNHVLISDADTIMIAPHLFMAEDKIVFYCDDEYWHCRQNDADNNRGNHQNPF